MENDKRQSIIFLREEKRMGKIPRSIKKDQKCKKEGVAVAEMESRPVN
jgi:hypothetical protein